MFSLDWDPSRELWTLDDIALILDLDIRRGSDHAEGRSLTDETEPRLLIADNFPHNDRTDADAATLAADLFEID